MRGNQAPLGHHETRSIIEAKILGILPAGRSFKLATTPDDLPEQQTIPLEFQLVGNGNNLGIDPYRSIR